MNSNEYGNLIRDYHDIDVVFQNLDAKSTAENVNISKNIRKLVSSLYSDIVLTRIQQDRKNIELVNVIFDNHTNELLSRLGGISQIFDRAKQIVLDDIRNGDIEQKYYDELLDRLHKELLKRLDSYRKNKRKEGVSDEASVVVARPDSQQMRKPETGILGNPKLIESMSKMICGTVGQTGLRQSRQLIKLLGNGELGKPSQKINAVGIGSIGSTNGNTGVFRMFRNIRKNGFGNTMKSLSYRNILGMFNVRRRKLDKRGFLGLYNKYIYDELMKRVDEFDNVVNFKGKMGKAILYGMLKWGGGIVVSGITKVIGLGWKTLKSAVKQMFNITKSVGRMGMTLLGKLKNFLFTGVGMYVIGFVSGVIYKQVLLPIFGKFKALFNLFLNPLKEFLGLDTEKESSLQEIKTAVAKKMKENLFETVKEDKIGGMMDNIEKINGLLDQVQYELRDIDMFMNGGGWKNAARGAISGSAGTIGTLVGMAVGSLVAPGLGTWIGGAIGGAIGGFAASFVKDFVGKLPKTDDEKTTRSKYALDMRRKWMGISNRDNGGQRYKTHQNLVVKRNSKRHEIDDIETKTKDIREKLDMHESGKITLTESELAGLRGELQKLEGQRTEKMGELSEIQSEIDRNGYVDDKKNDEVVNKMVDMLKDGKNVYFDVSGFGSMKDFFDDASRGRYTKRDELGKIVGKQKIIYDIKRHAMMTALNRYLDGQIDFNTILPFADSYVEQMSKRKIIEKDITAKGVRGTITKLGTSREADLSDYRYDDNFEKWWKLGNINEMTSKTDVLKHRRSLYGTYTRLYHESNGIQDESERIKYIERGIAEALVRLREDDKDVGNGEHGVIGVDENGLDFISSEKGGTGRRVMADASQEAMEKTIGVIRKLNKDVISEQEQKELETTLRRQLTGVQDKDVKIQVDIGKKMQESVLNKTKQKQALQKQVKEKEKKVERLREQHDKTVSQNKKYVEKVGQDHTVLIVEKDDDDITSANDETVGLGSKYLNGQYKYGGK